MLNKSDVMSILVNLEKTGLNIDTYMRKVLLSKDIPIDVLKFISQNNGLEASKFYNMLRIKHNKTKSKLYVNLLKDQEDEQEILTTLSSLLQQITLYNKKLEAENRDRFLKEIRAEEITRVLNQYFNQNNIETCKIMLSLIKKDLLVLEYLSDKRDLQ